MAGSVTTSPSVEHSDRVASSCAAVLGWIDVDDPRQIPRATTLAEIHDEKRALEGFFVRPQRRPRLCVEDRERAEQRLPMLDGNGRQQRVLLDGDWVGTLAATPHSALGCQASGGCELCDDARGERVLSATRRTDCARRRPPSSSHPNIAAQLGERSAGHPAQATRAARRVAAIDSAAATCRRATTHSSTCT